MVTVRRALLNDTSSLIDLMRAFYAESGYALDDNWAADSFQALLADERKGAIWIVSHGGTPAGYIVLTVRHSMEHGGLDGFIDDFYIRPGFRRQGLGRVAMDALFAECAKRNLMALHVEASRDPTAARQFYESLGLRNTADRRETLTLRFGSTAAGINSV